MLKRKISAAILAALFVLSPATGAYAANRYNMSYIYFGNTSSYYQHVESTQNTLNEISPSYFNLKDDGNLELTLAVDTRFIDEMHQKSIKVIPFLSNHWDRAKGIKALENRQKLADQIVDAVIRYKLDGINVDIENVTDVEKYMYTDFVRLLRDKLPEGTTLAVAVAPNPYGITKGWQGSYDYPGLAQYSDYLMIMAYDESYTGGPAGPVASYGFVEATIQKALTQVPKEKLVLGIPFYGRYWKNGVAKGGYGLSNTDVTRLVNNHNGKVSFDDRTKSPYAVITIGQTDAKPYVLGKMLEAGSYTIWYENETSIKYKLGLVNKYDLKGTGSWSLGQETKDTWNYYGMWLNGHYYEDAQGHWAQGSIISMADKAWMTGISTNVFAPDNVLTRAEAAVILVRALGLENKIDDDTGSADTSEENTGSADTFEENIDSVVISLENTVSADTSLEGIDSVDTSVKSTDFAVTSEENTDSADSSEESTDSVDTSEEDSGFTDVAEEDSIFSDIAEHWAKNEIEIAAVHGIVLGTGDGSFSPDKQLTRQEMAVMLDRILQQLEKVNNIRNPYTDISKKQNDWSYDAIVKLTHYNIFTGNPDGTFGAGKKTTRGQMAVLMDRVAQYMDDTSPVIAVK